MCNFFLNPRKNINRTYTQTKGLFLLTFNLSLREPFEMKIPVTPI